MFKAANAFADDKVLTDAGLRRATAQLQENGEAQETSPAALSPGYFSEEALAMADYTKIAKRVDGVMGLAQAELAAISDLADQSKNPAISKRLEVFRSLLSYAEHLRRESFADSQLLAWQASVEIEQMVDYFKLEAERFASPYEIGPTYNVRDFGAKGDGVTNDTPAFRQAFDAAVAYAKAAKIIIPRGDYLLEPEHSDVTKPMPFTSYRSGRGEAVNMPQWGNPKPHMVLVGTRRLCIEGEAGAKVLFAEPTKKGLLVIGADEMTIRNLTFDYRDRCFTQGKVVAINDDGRMDFQLDPGYPSPAIHQFANAPSFRITAHADDKSYASGTCVIEEVTELGNGLYRLTSLKTRRRAEGEPWNDIKVGMRASIIARYEERNATAALSFRFSRFCTVENVQIVGSPGHTMKGLTSYAMSLINYKVAPRHEKDLVSSTADAFMGGATPIGPYIANCDFSLMEDDGININSRCSEIYQVSPNAKADSPSCEGAEGVWIINLETGVIDAVAHVVDTCYSPALPASIRSVVSLRQANMSGEEKARLGYHTERASTFQRPHSLIPLNGATNGTIISNCRFSCMRGRGIQVTSPNMLVEDSEFISLTGSGVTISSLMSYGMGFAPHNVIARNCRFEKLGYQGVWVASSAIGNTPIESRPISHILITGNTFVGNPKFPQSLGLRNCRNVDVINNTFVMPSAGAKPIYVGTISQVQIKGSTFTPALQDNFIPISFGPDAIAAQVQMED